MKKILFISVLLASYLYAFSTSNVQFLDGNFQAPTFLDTQSGHKQTVTAEH